MWANWLHNPCHLRVPQKAETSKWLHNLCRVGGHMWANWLHKPCCLADPPPKKGRGNQTPAVLGPQMWAMCDMTPAVSAPPKRGGKPRWLHKSYYVGGLNGGKWGTYPIPSQKRYISLVMSNFAFFWGGGYTRAVTQKKIYLCNILFVDTRMNDTSLLLHSAAALRYCSSVPLHATAGAEWCYPRLLHSAAAFSCLCTVPLQTSACAMPVLLPSTTDAQCSCGGC